MDRQLAHVAAGSSKLSQPGGVGAPGPGPLPVLTAHIARLLRDGSLRVHNGGRVRPSQATGQWLLTWPAGACVRPGPQP